MAKKLIDYTEEEMIAYEREKEAIREKREKAKQAIRQEEAKEWADEIFKNKTMEEVVKKFYKLAPRTPYDYDERYIEKNMSELSKQYGYEKAVEIEKWKNKYSLRGEEYIDKGKFVNHQRRDGSGGIDLEGIMSFIIGAIIIITCGWTFWALTFK